MSVKAVPMISVDPVIIACSGHRPVTLRVVSEAWNSNWLQIKLAKPLAVIVRISQERSTTYL